MRILSDKKTIRKSQGGGGVDVVKTLFLKMYSLDFYAIFFVFHSSSLFI